MSLDVKNTKDSASTHSCSLAYGPSGIGKTHAFRTVPADRLLLVVTEGKHGPLQGYDCDVVDCQTYQEFIGSMRLIKAGLLNKTLEVNGRKKDIIGIDSLSCLGDLVIQDILQGKMTAVEGAQVKDFGDVEKLMELQDWGLYSARMKSIILAMSSMPCHLICTCLEALREDKASGRTMFTPNLSGKLALEVPRYFDNVFHAEWGVDGEGSKIRVWRTVGTDTITAKGHESLGASVLPDWTAVLKSIFGGKKKAAKKTSKKKESK